MEKQTINEKWVFTTLLTLTILSGVFLSLPSASADVVDNISVIVPKSCSMSSTLSSAHSTDINNGHYLDNIGETVIKATCNDAEGFSIYAIGFTDDEYGKTVLTSSLGETHNIITGTAESGSISNWAMKLSPVDGAYAPSILSDSDGSYSNYHVVPDTYTKVATRTSGTDLVVGASLKTTYSAYISGTQSAGTYEGKVKYTIVHPASKPAPYIPVSIDCEPHTICYYPNSNDHEGTMGKQTVDDNNATMSDGATVTLLASNFSREGYGFAGWNDSPFYDGNFYGPNETITAPTGVTNQGLSLYAVWVESEGSLQDSTKVASVCNRLTTAPIDGTANLGSVSALTDKRDGQTYAIAKLADGNCWMIENLRLEAEYTRGSYYESLAEGYGKSETYGNFIGLANSENASFANVVSSNSLYSENGANDTISIGSSDGSSYRFPRYNNQNTRERTSSPSSNSFPNEGVAAGMYSFGNYYSWPAALANTIYYSSSSATDADGKTSETVETSICPKNWMLPYGNNVNNGSLTGSFNYLNYKLNNNMENFDSIASNSMRKYPNNIILSGYHQGTTSNYRGAFGYYWSSTVENESSSYRLYINRTNIYPGTESSDKFLGFSVRCTLKQN